MLIHVKKSSFIILALFLMGHTGYAQNAPPAASAPAPAPKPQPSNNATEIDSSTSTALDYLFNHKAGEGTTMKAANEVAGALADKIKALDVLKTPGLDNPQVRERFETYISLKEVPQERITEYFDKMSQVTQTLKAGDTFGAWKILYSMGTYQDLDAGISRELAARVENFWNTDRTKNGLARDNEKYQDDAAKAIHNGDLDATDLAQQQAELNQKNAKGNSGGGQTPSASNTTNSPMTAPNVDPVAAEAALEPTLAGNLQGKLEMTGEYLNLLEARAKIKLNEIRANKMSDQDRMDFSDYIRTLYRGHRYYHVIIAADFYRAIFNEGDYPQDLSNQAVAGVGGNARTAADSAHLAIKSIGLNATGPASALNQLGGVMGGDTMGNQAEPVTIADEVTSALEINSRVSQAVEVFRYKADKGDIASSAGILQDAFIANEFHPALKGLPRDEATLTGFLMVLLSGSLILQPDNHGVAELADDRPL